MKNLVYGAGGHGEIFCKEIEKHVGEVSFFIDQYTDKKSLLGKPVRRLDDVCLNHANVYVSVTTPGAEKEVVENLRKKGAENVYSFKDTLHRFPEAVKECVKFTRTWYSSETREMVDRSALAEVKKLLGDEKSIRLLDTIMKFREELRPEQYPIPDSGIQYFPSDVELFRKNDKIRFVDGGSFIGDTLSESLTEFERLNKQIEYIAAFEPDPSNMKKLRREVEKSRDANPDVNFFIYPCGLWSSNEFLPFKNSGSSSSCVVERAEVAEGDITGIPVVSLDTVLTGAPPNFVKMDIEGSEKEAIRGARNILSDHAPDLAVCLYHRPGDLWEIPLLINEITPSYDMHLRLHGNLGMELVLYCVERKR